MTPVFANSAFVHVRESLVLKGGRKERIALRVRYGLVEHPRFGPVLIDAGYGPRVTEGLERSRLLAAYAAMLRPALVPEESPLAVLRQRGWTLGDVRIAILTHFHADHVSWCRDLPKARFVASGRAWRRIAGASTASALAQGVFRELLPPDFADRLDSIEAAPARRTPVDGVTGRDILGDGSVLAVDLPGHADGHVGLHFPDLPQPLLYAADAHWMLAAINADRAPGLPASLIQHDRAALRGSMAVARRFSAAGAALMTCHDPSPTGFDLPPP